MKLSIQQWRLSVLVLLLAAFMGGCTALPNFGAVEPYIPPLDNGQGRIFVYGRAQGLGSTAGTPLIRVDGEKVSRLVLNGIIWTNVQAGVHEVGCSVYFKTSMVTVNVEPGQERFIELFVIDNGLLFSTVDLILMEGKPSNLNDLPYRGPKLDLPESVK